MEIGCDIMRNMNIQAELDRRIELAQGIMARLDSSEPLSSILSQVRVFMAMTGSPLMVALMDFFIHGLTNIPYQPIPFSDETYKEAGIIHMKLCSIEDLSKIDFDDIFRNPYRDRIPKRNNVITISVYDMENLKTPLEPIVGDSHELLNRKLQVSRYYDRAKSILTTLRAYVYDQVSAVWLDSIREKGRIDLLGPDYKLITDKLENLESSVGNELLAAVDNLNSTNPAKWNASGLICRNVILKLARIVWNADVSTYKLLDGTELQLSNNKEKNKLLAYIDYFSRKATPDKRVMLTEAMSLIHEIYAKGSKGKAQIQRKEAQALVVDTFRFTELLNGATDLQPIVTLS